MSIFEVRDYHYDPDRWDAYKEWAHDAATTLQAKFDVVGFWLDAGLEPIMMGADPTVHPHGHPNVTWVIRWNDMDQRNRDWDELRADPEWLECWDRHPGFDGYSNMAVRFLEQA